MPSRRPSRGVPGKRCPLCAMQPALCVCGEIPHISADIKLVLIIHAAELKSTTNTGKLAARAFADSEVLVRGMPGKSDIASGLDLTTRQALLLYPTEEAALLTPEFAATLSLNKKPLTLIVPDGTWRQASKVFRREPALAAVPCVRLPLGPPSTYRLRTSPGGPGQLCTLEAIARAMGVLKDFETQASLERLLDLVVRRTLWSRGHLPLDTCRDVIPQAALTNRKAEINNAV